MITEKTRKEIIEKLNENTDPDYENYWNMYNSAVISLTEELIKISEKSIGFDVEEFASNLELDVLRVLKIIEGE